MASCFVLLSPLAAAPGTAAAPLQPLALDVAAASAAVRLWRPLQPPPGDASPECDALDGNCEATIQPFLAAPAGPSTPPGVA
eukprot:2540020-Prymnesium_polylepis.1